MNTTGILAIHGEGNIRQSKRLGILEIGRFIAATIVMCAHLPWLIQRFAARPDELLFGGWLPPAPVAVQYFFLLSGFVMLITHYQDFGRPLAVLNFWWRRACRIYPLYWLALVPLALYYYPLAKPFTWVQLITLLPGDFGEWVSPAWSLRYEIAFYIMFGLCLLPWVGKPLLAAWVFIVFWVCRPSFLKKPLGFGLPEAVNHFFYPTAARFFSGEEILFFVGLFCGWLYLRYPLSRRPAWSLLGFGIIWVLACMPLLNWGYGYVRGPWEPIVATGYGCVILALANLERSGAFRTGHIARRLGQVSYPIYILHMTLVTLLLTWFYGKIQLDLAAQYVALVLMLLTMLVLCAASAFGIDRPLQNWLCSSRTAKGIS